MRFAILIILSALLSVAASAQALYTVHTGPVPTGAPATNAIIVSHLYALSLDVETKVATWCGYRVTAASQYGRNSLNRNWLNRFPEGTLESQDYLHSGYSIGHLTPLASFRADPDAAELNWMGNVAPQRQELNAGVWLKLEDFARDQARLHGEAFVLVGPLYESDMPPLANADEPHTVPSHFWCRVRIPETGKLQCWIVPQDVERTADPRAYEVTCAEVCRRSGLKLCNAQPCEACDAASRNDATPNRDRSPDDGDAGLGRSPSGSVGGCSLECNAACGVRTGIGRREPTRPPNRQPSDGDLPRAVDRRDHHSDANPLGDWRRRDPAPCACSRSGWDARNAGTPSETGRVMANSINVFVEANDQADALLAQFPHELRFNTLPKALKAAAVIVQKNAQDRLPDPGYPGDKDPTVSLKKHIIVRVRRYDAAVVAIVGARYLGVNHAHLVEYGHRLVRKIKQLDGSVTKVEIGFVSAKPFMRPAGDETRDAQANALISLINSELEKFQKTFV